MALDHKKKKVANKNDNNIMYVITDKIYFSKLNMIDMQYVYLKNSCIKNLPEDFFVCLPTLKWLDLRNNLLCVIPKSIEHHVFLETLLLSDNIISRLPVEMCTLKNLKHIQLSGNPLKFPKYIIVNSGIDVLKEYLKIFYNKSRDITDDIIDIHLTDICNETNECNDKDKKRKALKHDSSKEMKTSKKVISNSDKYVKLPKPLNKTEMTKRIAEKSLDEAIIEKKIKRLSETEHVLQKAKSLDQLKRWREKYNKEKLEKIKATDSELDVMRFPYGTDEGCDKILTRKELLKIQDSLNKKQKCERNMKHKNGSEDVNLDAKMIELEEVLKDIHLDRGEESPRSHQETIAEAMKKLKDLQKKILLLKTENDNFNKN